MTTVIDEPLVATTVERSFPAIGTQASVIVQDPFRADTAAAILRDEINAIDLACSRFRADSELQMVHDHAGQTVRISTLLFDALSVACAVAQLTGGAVDPTVGNAIARLGYDEDFSQVTDRPPVPPSALGPVVGYQHVQLNREQRTVRIPRGVRLDLGSSAKALVADRSAARIAEEIGSGVLVCIGGDVSVVGSPPPGGWAIGIAERSATSADEVDQVVAIHHGGLASSAPSVRTWVAGNRPVNHIINPETGDCVDPYWLVVSACAASCVEANAMTTAAMVWGRSALEHLMGCTLPMRLVRHDGRRIVSLNGWPREST
jgi:thiamine biosynthesis lipoprotein